MYNKLILKKIKGFFQNVNENMIIEALEESFKYAFSIFPYVFNNLNSEEALIKFNSGNCISLSLAIKKYLKDKYNLDSYLIPATIPNKYKHPKYLDISHVGLAIPKSKSEFYIADSAFYFLNPILVKVNDLKSKQLVFSKNIYSHEPSKVLTNYSTIEKIISQTFKYTEKKIFNEYQCIPKNTYYSECYYNDDLLDKWKYFLIEICNPDEAISTFFINIKKKDPFITTCFGDKNGICKQRYYISFRYNTIRIQEYANKSKIINLDNIDENEIKYLEKKLFKYFKGNFMKYINMFKNGYNLKNYYISMVE